MMSVSRTRNALPSTVKARSPRLFSIQKSSPMENIFLPHLILSSPLVSALLTATPAFWDGLAADR